MPVNENRLQFQDRIRTLRESKGLSQTQLAEDTGLMPSAISHFETGRRSPSFDNLKKLADALNVTVDYLLGRADKPEAGSPALQALFRKAEGLSAADVNMLAGMADMLTKKNRQKHGSDDKK